VRDTPVMGVRTHRVVNMNTDLSCQNTFNLKMLLVLSFGHLATDLCQGALPAILPFLKTKLFLSYTMTTVIILASSVTSSVIQPLFGYLSDRREKALLLPFGCLAAGVGLSLLAVPDHYEVILLLVIISGLGIASYHPEGFKTARFFTGPKMATGMAVFSVGGNLGFALGPVTATYIIAQYGLDFLPLMIAFSLVFLSLLLWSWGSLAEARTVPVSQRSAGNLPSRGRYLSLGVLISTVVMRSWTHVGLMTFIPFYYIDYQKGDPVYAGSLMSAFLLGGAMGTLLGSPVADRWGYKKFLTLSLALTAALFPLIFLTDGVMLFVALGVVGMALISSFSVTIVMAQELLPGSLGMASGLMAGFAIGTGGIGATMLGVVADHFGVVVATKCIMVFPVLGVLISLLVKSPAAQPT
jgi:MFS transporter, FSR family, fosmidomycin resistance protein